MTLMLMKRRLKLQQKGLSLVEVLLSVVILGATIIPALDSLRSGLQAAAVQEQLILEHYSLLSKMQEVKNLPFNDLLSAAASAGSHTKASVYSDPPGVAPRRLVYISFYDVDDSDSDGNTFTIADPDTDGDNNPYTVAPTETPLSLLWISVDIESGSNSMQTLVLR